MGREQTSHVRERLIARASASVRNRAIRTGSAARCACAHSLAGFRMWRSCDDIMNTVRSSGLPALLIHCQVMKVPEPPAMRITGTALWWTDLEQFASAFTDVRPRRGNERKEAAYFSPSCFQPIDTLGRFLSGGWLDRASRSLAGEGCPALYRKRAS